MIFKNKTTLKSKLPERHMIKKNKKIFPMILLIAGICGMIAGLVLLIIIAISSINLMPGDTSQRSMVIAMLLIFAAGTMFFAFGLGFIKNFPKYASKYSSRHIRKKNQLYLTYPLRKIMDFSYELNQTRTAFAADNDPRKNMITYREKKKLGILAKYMSASDIIQYEAVDYSGFYDYSTLESGIIYYGCLVQANVKLFQKKTLFDMNEYPACILYSKDPYFESDPLKLIPIARRLFADKENNVLKNERDYEYHLEVPDEITGGKKVYMSTLMVDRTLLPMNILLSGIFPIIAAPEQSKSVFIIDDKYWTKNLITNFIFNKFENHDYAEIIFDELYSAK